MMMKYQPLLKTLLSNKKLADQIIIINGGNSLNLIDVIDEADTMKLPEKITFGAKQPNSFTWQFISIHLNPPTITICPCLEKTKIKAIEAISIDTAANAVNNILSELYNLENNESKYMAKRLDR